MREWEQERRATGPPSVKRWLGAERRQVAPWPTVTTWARRVWWVLMAAVGIGFVTGDGEPEYWLRFVTFVMTGACLALEGRARWDPAREAVEGPGRAGPPDQALERR